jgi:hypothetical protein
MISSTVLGIFFVPVFFLLIRSWFSGKPDVPAPGAAAVAESQT